MSKNQRTENNSKAEAEAQAQAEAMRAAELAEAEAQAQAEAKSIAERTYPWSGKAVNNTPIPIYLSEAGVHLAANFHAPANEAEVTYQSADHFAREMASVDAIASVHGFKKPLILSELDKTAAE